MSTGCQTSEENTGVQDSTADADYLSQMMTASSRDEIEVAGRWVAAVRSQAVFAVSESCPAEPAQRARKSVSYGYSPSLADSMSAASDIPDSESEKRLE